jgi:hypothetical protein
MVACAEAILLARDAADLVRETVARIRAERE